MHIEKDLKFMRAAKIFGEQFVTCLSPRKIGTVIVKNGRVISQGVNGPPNSVLHLEDRYVKIDEKTSVFGKGWFYSNLLNEWVKMISHDCAIDTSGRIKCVIQSFSFTQSSNRTVYYESFNANKNQCLVKFKDENDRKGEIIKQIEEPTCPRYICDIKSSEGLSICSCVHSEENAILNCARNGISCDKSIMYCYCTLPCSMCAGMIINSGISTVVCLANPGKEDYSYQSRSFFNEAKIEIIEIPEEEI